MNANCFFSSRNRTSAIVIKHRYSTSPYYIKIKLNDEDVELKQRTELHVKI